MGYCGKEIDFLGIDIKNNRRVHLEVHASVSPFGPLRPWAPAKYGKVELKERVKHYFNKKFVGSIATGTGELKNRCVKNTASKFLGSKNYEKWLVLGKLYKKDSEDQLKQEFEKYGVKVFFIRDILKQIKFRRPARDPTGRFIQLLLASLEDETSD